MKKLFFVASLLITTPGFCGRYELHTDKSDRTLLLDTQTGEVRMMVLSADKVWVLARVIRRSEVAVTADSPLQAGSVVLQPESTPAELPSVTKVE